MDGNLPPRFEEAFLALNSRLGFTVCEDGKVLRFVHGGCGLSIQMVDDQIVIRWEKTVMVYRALSLVKQHWGEETISIEEVPCFETMGMMFDVSRNAVLKVDTMKTILDKMALMGMNLGMMYTEDTYEIPSEPYFGWMRGRYTIQELKELDDYADLFGIELCPCIQTLGHLNRMLHWPVYAHLKENEEVLLADEEKTYAFLEKAIYAATLPYRSKRIHIGMDEAHGVGLGSHLSRFGYENPHAIIRRHLARIHEITDRLGLEVMMWSDMYFRPDSPTNGYYDTEMPSQESKDAVFQDVTLVYWDYYHNQRQVYADMLKKHQALGASTAFAGGIWTWTGPAPDYDKTIAASVPGLEAARDAKIPMVLATAWGDNGAEANLNTALLGMQLYAEFQYTGTYDPKQLDKRFEVCCGSEAEPFLQLSAFNTVPGMRSGPMRPVNTAKFMLYQDPLVQLYEADTKGIDMAAHYLHLQQLYAAYAEKEGEYQKLFQFYRQLASVLAAKCLWHQQIGQAVRAGDRNQAESLRTVLETAEREMKSLRILWMQLWNHTNKPFGFEIIDGRLGAVCARMETACIRIQEWVDGGEVPAELLEPALPYTRNEDGTLFGSYAIGEIVSASKIDL